MDSVPPVGPRGELLIAVVLNGGVSLAVWMGGAAHELNRLTRARPVSLSGSAAAERAVDPYSVVLGLADTEARVDVIAGSSAGGINGAALAIGQANPNADLAALRSLWTDQGRMGELLRRPYRGEPTSLLRGQYFQEQLTRAMAALAASFPPDAPPSESDTDQDRPRRLPPERVLLTTTLLTPTRTVTVDDVGQRLPDISQEGLFRFTANDFTYDTIDVTAQAARASASFPFAFEPAFVPVNQKVDGLRDMAPYAQWSPEGDTTTRSRFAIDGGVLANTALVRQKKVRRLCIRAKPRETARRPSASGVTQPHLADVAANSDG